MARYKPARGRKAAPATRPQAIGCVIVLVTVFALVYLVMYYAIKQG